MNRVHTLIRLAAILGGGLGLYLWWFYVGYDPLHCAVGWAGYACGALLMYGYRS